MDKNINKNELQERLLEAYNIDTLHYFLTESYEGIEVMVDYFKDNLHINEREFTKKFNIEMGKLISYYGNGDSIMDQLPSQFIFNNEHKKAFIELLPIKEKDIVDVIREWTVQTQKKFGGTKINDKTIKEIFALTYPYLYIAFTCKDEQLRDNIFMMVNMLMYSMSYAVFFPNFDYIKDKGEYVIQKILINKGYAKYENIYDLMVKTSQDTYETFSKRPLTDRVLYEVTWSNIQGKMKYYMRQFFQAYQSVGNKYLTTNKDVIATKDKDGESSLVATNIENDNALVQKLVNDVTTYVGHPEYIEDKILRETLLKIMNIDTRTTRNNIEKKTLVERNLSNMIIELQKTRDFDLVINNLFVNFLWGNPSRSFNVNQIETPVFISEIIYDISYIKKSNIYVNKMIEILDVYIGKILSNRGKDIESIDNKTLQRYRKSIIYYFALLSQLVVKRG